MKGTYFYKYKERTGREGWPYWQLTSYRVRCDIIAESKKTYTIKLLGQHANGAPIGHVMRVQRKHVKLDEIWIDEVNAITPEIADKVKARAESIRLPYKDD